MKSPKKNGIGEVVTEYGTRVMKVIKKGLLGRSLFDFYGDIKAQAFKTKESSSVPSTPADGKGGVIYTKSADGKLYYKSNEVSEVELSASDTVLTSEQVQDIVGAMFSGNTETNITVTYQDADGTIDLVSTDTNTQLSAEEVQDIVGAMFTSNTETRISATYEDSDGTIDLVVDAIPVDLTVDGAGTIHANNVPTLNQNTTGTAAGLSNVLSVNKGGTGASTLTSNSLLTGNGTSAIEAESDLTFSSGTLTLTDSNISKPSVQIKSTGGAAHIGGSLDFITDEGDAGASGDILGKIRFIGDNADQDTPQQTYAQIQGKVDVATDGEESGILELQVANHDDDLETGLTLTGGSQNAEIDVTVGLGTSSVTTIAGTLTTGSTAALDNSGLIQVAGQPNITSLHSSIAITKQVKVTLSTANCNALHTTPIELVAAQGANTVIVPTGGMIRVDRALTQSNSGSDINFHYEGKEPGVINQDALVHYRRFMYNESGDRVFHIIPAMSYSEVSQNLINDVNKALEISVDSAFTSNCFTSIDLSLIHI